ncbi:MAG: hypothetical protein AMK69_11025 [Nitrospira bacterium SG8_3]|nr:MAG: hypothetical protein AMK69_11025 [Nitrospira bacterium SG8_3]
MAKPGVTYAHSSPQRAPGSDKAKLSAALRPATGRGREAGREKEEKARPKEEKEKRGPGGVRKMSAPGPEIDGEDSFSFGEYREWRVFFTSL